MGGLEGGCTAASWEPNSQISTSDSVPMPSMHAHFPNETCLTSTLDTYGCVQQPQEQREEQFKGVGTPRWP